MLVPVMLLGTGCESAARELQGRTLNRPARSIERTKPWLVLTQLLIAWVVLFDDVIQVETGSTSAPTPQFLLPLKFRDHFLGVTGCRLH